MNSKTGSSESSEIASFFANKSIFITGGTGFLGKVLIEKLLRSCYGLDKIYVLIRAKRGKTPTERLNKLVECKLFSSVAKLHPDFRQKLVPITGDILLEKLGISEDEERKLVENVNVVFHSAATVKFSEPLKTAVQMNVIGTQRVVELVKSIKKLDAFIHISTAYSNCDKKYIEEKVYNPPADPEQLISAMQWLDDDIIDTITPKLIKKYPNTYTFTKAVAETLVIKKAKDLPCAIIRPSIVCSTWCEPFAGWVDSLNGAASIYIGIGKGLLRVMLIDDQTIADYIPVDILVNAMITSAWITAKEFKQRSSGSDNQIKVYNCTSGQINPAFWHKLIEYVNAHYYTYPMENMLFVPYFSVTKIPLFRYLRRAIEQYLPALAVDVLLRLMNKKPFMMDLQNKVSTGTEALEYFTMNKWTFKNDNVFALMDKMSVTDRLLFNFDVRVVNWKNFQESMCLGAKEHILREDMTKMKENRQLLRKKKLVQNTIWVICTIVLAKIALRRWISAKDIFCLLVQLATAISKRVSRIGSFGK